MHLLATQKGRGSSSPTLPASLLGCPLGSVRLPRTRLRQPAADHVADRQEGEEHPPFRRVEAVHYQRRDQYCGRGSQVDEELARLGGRLGLGAPLYVSI